MAGIEPRNRAPEEDPNKIPGPNFALISDEGRNLLEQDPDQFLEQALRVVQSQGWDRKDVEKRIDVHKQTEICKEALERFRLVDEIEGEQRKREVEDLKFDRALPEDQWDVDIHRERKNQKRPVVVVSRLDQPVQQVMNEARQARIAVQVKARGPKANRDGAEIRQGLYRAIEVDSGADYARHWALERAVKCGRGAYRIAKEYRNDGDFDMDLAIKRILNQGAVYFDPWATEPDWSDGEWCLITEDIAIERYRRMFPNSRILGLGTGDFESYGNVPASWMPGKSVRIAEYFRVVYEPVYKVFDSNTNKTHTLSAEEAKQYDLQNPPEGVKIRKVDKRKVEWFIINAVEVLDTETWEGRYIPVVPVIGKEYVVDGKERVYKGMISNAKDAQRMYNYFKALQIEAGRLTTQETYTADPRALEGHTAKWEGVKILPYRAEINGVPIPEPKKVFKEPELQSLTLTLHEIDMDIKATTGRHSASLGEYGPERSGRAIREMKQQGESTTSNYLENLARVSMKYEARVVLDMMKHVYDTERVVRILGEEDNEKSVIINAPFYDTPDGPIPEAEMPQPGIWQKAKAAVTGRPMQAPKLKNYDLKADDDYAFVVTVGRSYKTQREEDQAVFEAIIKANPNLAPIIAPLWLESLEGPAATKAAALLRKLDPRLRDPEEGEAEIPPEVQAQMQQQDMMIQQLTEALNQKTQELETEQHKLDAEIMMKQMDNQTKLTIELAKIKAQIVQAEAKLESSENVELLKREAERIENELQRGHELIMEELKSRSAANADARKAKIGAEADERKKSMQAESEIRQGAIKAATTPRKDDDKGSGTKAPRDFEPPSDSLFDRGHIFSR